MSFPSKTTYFAELAQQQLPKVYQTKPKINIIGQDKFQQLFVSYPAYKPERLIDYLNELNFLNPSNSVKFVYNYQQNRIDYTNNMANRHMYTTDPNWGNLYQACLDLVDYDWIKNNKRAHHVLEVDPRDFYVMQAVLKSVLTYFKKQREQHQC